MKLTQNSLLITILLVVALATAPTWARALENEPMNPSHKTHDYRGRSLVVLDHPDRLPTSIGEHPGELVLTTPVIDVGFAAHEFVVSWNADASAGSAVRIEARAIATVGGAEHASRYYVLANWSPDNHGGSRTSVNDQQDEDGDVQTDTLVLKLASRKLQLKITLVPASSACPTLQLLTVAAADTTSQYPELPSDKRAWGKELPVPYRSQVGWVNAAGWCSPTSTCMVLSYWAEALHRPEMNLPVPDVAGGVFDTVYNGTGNWPFNTAFAGSFPGIRAYVTRFSDIRELEEWTLDSLPVVVSVSYDLLQGKDKPRDAGHLMVCVGFTQTGDIILNDPFHFADKGEPCRKVFPRSNFRKAWAHSKQAVYLIYPTGSKLPENRYGHWAD